MKIEIFPNIDAHCSRLAASLHISDQTIWGSAGSLLYLYIPSFTSVMADDDEECLFSSEEDLMVWILSAVGFAILMDLNQIQ